MIVCPNCNHQNPDGAVQCEACYTPLPSMITCPSCSASVQADASFCGQCGFNLKAAAVSSPMPPSPVVATVAPEFDIPDLLPPDPLVAPEPLIGGELELPPQESFAPSLPPDPLPAIATSPEPPFEAPLESATLPPPPAVAVPPTITQVPPVAANVGQTSAGQTSAGQTQLQVQTAKLLHIQTNTTIELPQHLPVLHIGKQNDRIPPDVDVSGFPNSEIVSRIHADIRVEGDAFYIEDVGSSNGTFVNNLPLPAGNRHRLRPGDRIALGKGDKVTFLFQLS
ncbi:MAG TPA: FHA domain-containing protein [Chroococcidiopsis sp.]